MFGNEDSEAVFSPHYPRGHVVSGVGFSHCTRGPAISVQCTSSKQMKVGEEIRVHKFLSSTRNRELTWNHSGCCSWNCPRVEPDKAEKKACCQVASGVTTCCNLSRRVIEEDTALQASCLGKGVNYNTIKAGITRSIVSLYL